MLASTVLAVLITDLRSSMNLKNGQGYQRSKRKYQGEDPLKASLTFIHNQGSQGGNQRIYDNKGLPTGWLDCPAYGNVIDCLIPSKVPLDRSFDNHIPPDKRYSSQQVIDQQNCLGRQIGLVIDLTNTSRYYPASDWRNKGIEYMKIRCKGRDSVPDNESVNKFLNVVLQFRSQEQHAKKYIIVHCTHGHNRTGYMVIHFLKHITPVTVTEALEIFARARHPGIYKQEYIDALYSFYHEEKPDFWFALDLQNGRKNLVKENSSRTGLMTNDDVLGDPVSSMQQEKLQHLCYRLLQLKEPERGNKRFPGSHPVSLNRENMMLLKQHTYYATWKADGTRYMMLITLEGCYIIDRKFSFRMVSLRFPCKNIYEGETRSSHHCTLLDGEMVIDMEPETKKQVRRYLIYDLMAINGKCVVEKPFKQRFMMIEDEVIKPRNYERDILFKSGSLYYRYDLEPFSVRRKNFYMLSAVTKLLKDFIPKLSHAADGLIFQGWDDTYTPWTHNTLLKWKFPEMNSVDFLCKVRLNNYTSLHLFDYGKEKLMKGSRVIFPEGSDVASYSGRIIECSWDPHREVWIFMRIRTDKSTPNGFNVYKKVMRSIRDNITEDDLLKIIYSLTDVYSDKNT